MSRMLIAATVLCLLLSALAADEPVRWRISADEIETPYDDWFGLYIKGEKAGYVHVRFDRLGEESPGFLQLMEMELKMIGMGTKTHMKMSQRSEYEPMSPFRMRTATSQSVNDGLVTTIGVSNTLDELQAIITEPLGRRQITREPTEISLSDDLTTGFWIRSKPKVGDRLTVRAFSVEDLEDSLSTYTVTAVKDTVVSGVKTRYYEGRIHSSTSGDMGIGRIDEDGYILSWQMGIMEIRREPEKLAKDFDYGADVFILTKAKIDKPLGKQRNVASMVVEVLGEGAETLKPGPRQDIVRTDDGRIVLRLGDAARTREKAGKEEIEKALAETVEYPVNERRVAALAGQAVGDATDPREKVRRLVAFVDTYLEDASNADSTSALEIIARKAGDCTEHAHLFTCLARAAGIPTREASGLMYMGDEDQAFGGHAWNEVVLDGEWVPVDPTWGEFPTDGTHIRFGADDHASGTMLQTMGKLRLKLIEIQRK